MIFIILNFKRITSKVKTKTDFTLFGKIVSITILDKKYRSECEKVSNFIRMNDCVNDDIAYHKLCKMIEDLWQYDCEWHDSFMRITHQQFIIERKRNK